MRTHTPKASVETHRSLRSAIRDGLLLQAPLLLLSALMLDGGTMLRVALIALVAKWVVSLVIWHFRSGAPTRVDLLFVRWGYVPLLIATYFAAILWMPR
jgi:hypothetical protein